jgi:hypothetical protein
MTSHRRVSSTAPCAYVTGRRPTRLAWTVHGGDDGERARRDGDKLALVVAHPAFELHHSAPALDDVGLG